MTSLLLLKSMLFANVMQKSKNKKRVKLKKFASKNKILHSSMCRICNEEKGNIPIFSDLLPDIASEIKNFGGVCISKTDALPKNICQSCFDLLNGCIMFRDMCQKTNEKLIELSIKQETVLDPIKLHDDNSNEYEPYNFQDSDYLLNDNSELWGCTICNKEFYDLKPYNKHLSECNKKVSEQSVPVGRIKEQKSYLCDICGKTARSNASLLIHMGIHENVFPFKCDACPYQGRTMDLLKVHKRSHLVEKPYKCSQCPKATTTSSNLAKHVRHVHSTTRPHKCTYCDKAFSYQHDMKRHIKDIHLRQGTVECDVCYKKFNTKKILQGHRWKIHKIKGERQGRLPSYLQHHRLEESDNNMSNCDLSY